MLQIIKDENFLRQVSKPLTDFSQEFFSIVKDMFILLKETGGLGLAAPQVGRLERFFIVKTPGTDPVILINPTITFTSMGVNEDWEGCLSFPGKLCLIERANNIGIQSFNMDTKKYFLAKADGLLARVIQHENDHLDGLLFTDRAKKTNTSI